jgi:predicted AAA+ superfamily ATPase
MKALKQAMKDLKIDKSYIITYGEEKTVQVEEGTICIIKAWHWLLT